MSTITWRAGIRSDFSLTTKLEAQPPSKKDAVLALISRKNGATLAEIMEATARQKHTVRGFISILGKAGTKIESSKSAPPGECIAPRAQVAILRVADDSLGDYENAFSGPSVSRT